MRILWNLFLVFMGITLAIVFFPLIIVPIGLYMMTKPKEQPQAPTVVVVRDKD